VLKRTSLPLQMAPQTRQCDVQFHGTDTFLPGHGTASSWLQLSPVGMHPLIVVPAPAMMPLSM
jgi:hypothetical protein